MNIEKIVEYLKHHIPIIIKDDKGWCNADIYFENGTLIVKPDYNIPFDDQEVKIMSAKEMFERLGYNCKKSSNYTIIGYYKIYKEQDGSKTKIEIKDQDKLQMKFKIYTQRGQYSRGVL